MIIVEWSFANEKVNLGLVCDKNLNTKHTEATLYVGRLNLESFERNIAYSQNGEFFFGGENCQ